MRRAICWLLGCDIVEAGGDWQAECSRCGEVQHYHEPNEPPSVYYANVAVRAKDKS